MQLGLASLMVILAVTTGLAQQSISGKVMDEDGPLIGASVIVDGTSIGALTDATGTFTLDVPADATTLIISYLGYAKARVSIADGSYSNIVLVAENNSLNEVVITGLATSIKRSNLANAIASIDADELVGISPQPTLDGALYGKFKGADIRANSGAPGGGFSIRLRGVTSVFLNQQPVELSTKL